MSYLYFITKVTILKMLIHTLLVLTHHYQYINMVLTHHYQYINIIHPTH